VNSSSEENCSRSARSRRPWAALTEERSARSGLLVATPARQSPRRRPPFARWHWMQAFPAYHCWDRREAEARQLRRTSGGSQHQQHKASSVAVMLSPSGSRPPPRSRRIVRRSRVQQHVEQYDRRTTQGRHGDRRRPRRPEGQRPQHRDGQGHDQAVHDSRRLLRPGGGSRTGQAAPPPPHPCESTPIVFPETPAAPAGRASETDKRPRKYHSGLMLAGVTARVGRLDSSIQCPQTPEVQHHGPERQHGDDRDGAQGHNRHAYRLVGPEGSKLLGGVLLA